MKSRIATQGISPLQVLEGKTYWKGWDQNLRARSSARGNGRVAKREGVSVDYSRFTPDDYLLSWFTAVAGVELESDKHTIVVPHNKFVNDNGNAFANNVLLESYHSFIFAENFTEHVSLPEFSKGKVLDAVAWVVERQFNNYPEPIPTVFIDCLLATNKKKHPRLVEKVLSGLMNTASMGCDVLFTQCSRCGKVIEEGEDKVCTHIESQLGRYYEDSKGNRRRVAELCGVEGKKGSCVFKELSLVAKPAFILARLHGFLDYGDESTGRPLKSIVPYGRYRESNKDI